MDILLLRRKAELSSVKPSLFRKFSVETQFKKTQVSQIEEFLNS